MGELQSSNPLESLKQVMPSSSNVIADCQVVVTLPSNVSNQPAFHFMMCQPFSDGRIHDKARSDEFVEESGCWRVHDRIRKNNVFSSLQL
jgi:hypothetical protein